MKINILRSETDTPQNYELPDKETTLLGALTHIKATQDATLTFTAGCRASVCGTCSVRVNGREELACAYKIKDGSHQKERKHVTLSNVVPRSSHRHQKVC